MTWRNWGWHGWYLWFQVALTATIVALLAVLYFDNETPDAVKVFIAVALFVVLVLIYTAHPWITITPGSIRIGYFPLYRRTLPMREVQDIRVVNIRPMRKYGGFGVRGLAKSDRGLLLGGYPPRGLRFETFDGRRYIVTLRDLDPVVRELSRHGCTLSAGNGDDFAEGA